MATEDIDWLDLPGRWTYGVCSDGRIYFVNDETKSTCWTHPSSGCPIQSGHFTWSDMPNGWEMDSTPQGAVFFIKPKTTGVNKCKKRRALLDQTKGLSSSPSSCRSPKVANIGPEEDEASLYDTVSEPGGFT